MIANPEALRQKLIGLFPNCEQSFVDDDEYDYGYTPPMTYHYVWMRFAPIAKACLTESNDKTRKAFYVILNDMVDKGGDEENAVSTCLLEHASQLGLKKMLKPYLSKGAQRQLR